MGNTGFSVPSRPCTFIILTAPQACRDRAEGYIQLSLGSVKAGAVWSTVLKWAAD